MLQHCLDDIDNIPLATQIKVLRVLEEKEIERVGEHPSVKVDARIICATHRDLVSLLGFNARGRNSRRSFLPDQRFSHAVPFERYCGHRAAFYPGKCDKDRLSSFRLLSGIANRKSETSFMSGLFWHTEPHSIQPRILPLRPWPFARAGRKYHPPRRYRVYWWPDVCRC